MTWFPLNADLVNEALNPQEAAAVLQRRRAAAEGSGVASGLPGHAEALAEAVDPLPGICSGIAARIRAAVLGGGRSSLGGADETYIPNALRGEATAILRLKLLTRYALNVTEDRRREAEEAEKRLDAIQRGELPLADGAVVNRPTYHNRPNRWKPSTAGGVMPLPFRS